MNFLKKLLGGGSDSNGMSDHLVRLHIPLIDEMPVEAEFDRYTELEDALDEVVQGAGVGSLDGNEAGGNEYTIWFYGPDARHLSEVIKKALESKHLPPGCKLFVRFGGVNDKSAREETIDL